jgi:hypothetical protein
VKAAEGTKETTAEPSDAGTQEHAAKAEAKAKDNAATPAEDVIQQIEDNAASAKPKPVMLLCFQSDAPFCLGALQCGLNSKAAAHLARDEFLCLKADMADLQKNGLAKKLGVKNAQIMFMTPGTKVVARFSDPNMSAEGFLDLLRSLAVKSVKETKKELDAKAKAEKAVEKAAEKKKSSEDK